MKAIELTEVSWILYNDAEIPTGLIVQRQKEYTVLSTDISLNFESKEKMFNHYGVFKFMSRPEKQAGTSVAGFPVLQDEVFNIDETAEMPSFTKTQKSTTRHAAGHWGIQFSDQYVTSFCPKVSTLTKYDCLGPFTDRIIAQSEVRRANKQ